jgi:hypothetical protein
LAEAVGRPFMPWQRQVVDVALEVTELGQFAYKLVIVTVPRQSGKTTAYGLVMEHRAMTMRGGRVWFTFQSQKDAVDWLLNEHWPILAPFHGVCRLRRAAGSEHVLWPSGGLVRPFPPTPSGLHSKISDLVVVDEPWSFDLVKGRQIDQGIVPTQATKPNAQVWKVSTAGDANSVWWLGSVEAGRAAVAADRREGIAYFEWSCPDNLDPCAEESWPVFHPAFGRTIQAPAMHAALDQLGPDEFSRAFGNRWVSTVARVIPAPAWLAAGDVDQPLPTHGLLSLGFDVAIDRSDACIVAAWLDGDVVRLEVAEWREGSGWVAERLKALRDRWTPSLVAYDAHGPAVDIADAAARLGVELMPLKAADVVVAAAGFLEAVIAEPPALRYRPHQALDDAAAAATRRALGDAWTWGRRQSTVSLSALTAATAARWAALHAPGPTGPFRIW